MSNIELILKDITDPYVRENFFRISRFLGNQAIFDGDFEFFEIEINQANTTTSIQHGLKFIPEDVIILSVVGNYNFYFEYANFTTTELKIFTEGPCKLRFFAGLLRDKNYGRKISNLTLIPPNAATGAATTWFTGIAAPAAGVGDVGDFFLNTITGDVYYKSAPLTWVGGYNILDTHPATAITIDDSASSNTIVGDNVQEYIDRFNEPSESESPTYNGDGTINHVEHFSSAVQIVGNRIFRVDLTYDADLQPLTEVWKIYSKTNGTTILKTISIAYSWVANVLTNKTQVTT